MTQETKTDKLGLTPADVASFAKAHYNNPKFDPRLMNPVHYVNPPKRSGSGGGGGGMGSRNGDVFYTERPRRVIILIEEANGRRRAIESFRTEAVRIDRNGHDPYQIQYQGGYGAYGAGGYQHNPVSSGGGERLAIEIDTTGMDFLNANVNAEIWDLGLDVLSTTHELELGDDDD